MVLVVLMETALIVLGRVLMLLERVLMGQTASAQMDLDTGLVMGRMVLDVSLTITQAVLMGLIMVLMAPRSALVDLHVGRVRDRDLGQGIPRTSLKIGLITRHHLAALGLGLVLLLLPVLLVYDAARIAPNIYPHGQTIGLVSVHDTPKIVPSTLHHHLHIGLGLVLLLLATHEMEVNSHHQKVLSHAPVTLMDVLKMCLNMKEVPNHGTGLLHVNLKTSLNTHHHMALGHGQNTLHDVPRIDPNIYHHLLGIGPGLVLLGALKMDLSTRHQEVRNHGQDIPLATQRVNLETRLESAPVTAPGTVGGRASPASSFFVESQTDTTALALLARFWTIRPWYRPISSLSI
jgi:hypothetical protein